ncbi:TetR/AcrR family transcriptional regulator [Aeromicrobium phragmitis]|uniref:TetR/AcrR family transcriptional regulator n=1 Tax=Aeromicrobium phragmitis TaxID=2478914 RepID=A0A3L8PIP4_9ACTN|nr:TetR/AcrR family transcriptional regulator [Aeromicrobium phragmitis]RLV55265.1 TetR/AcrR family transcriptional regulator [Aeromicrobium phragmitis]
MPVEERRARRTREIVEATRRLFDERGVRAAQIEDIAKAVGINRAIIYRHFTTKEELFAMTLVDYLGELEARIAEADDAANSPTERLSAQADAFFAYGAEYPAFVDCAQALLRFRGRDLVDEVSQERLIELGQAMFQCLNRVVRALEDGTAAGEFAVTDPQLMSNILYAEGLGVLNLVNFQKSVRSLHSGLPFMDDLPFDEVVEHAKRSLIAMAIGPSRPAGTR